MQYKGSILEYSASTKEEVGMWAERIVCDMAKIDFKSKRAYMKDRVEYPEDLAKDLAASLGPELERLSLTEHAGNLNQSHDFCGKFGTVSLKTNYTATPFVCPQKIGQTSPMKLVAALGYDPKTVTVQDVVRTHSGVLVQKCLENLFTCDTTVMIDFRMGDAFFVHKTGPVKFAKKTTFVPSKHLWDKGVSLSLARGGGTFLKLEMRKTVVVSRFRLHPLLDLIKSGAVGGLSVQRVPLLNRYIISQSKD